VARIVPTLVVVTGLPGTGKSTVAAIAADELGTAVVAHDWAMSSLRGYPTIQSALDALDGGHRMVGWSILVALAQAQLVENRSVVLDGVARQREQAQCAALARDAGARLLTIATHCSDIDVHRQRIDGRRRGIPGWRELRWEDVERAARGWERVEGDLNLDAVRPWAENESRLRQFFAEQQFFAEH
jgi:hypothetical protein